VYDAGVTTLYESPKLEENEVQPKDNTPVRENESVDTKRKQTPLVPNLSPIFKYPEPIQNRQERENHPRPANARHEIKLANYNGIGGSGIRHKEYLKFAH